MTDGILEGFGDPIVEIDEQEFNIKLKKINETYLPFHIRANIKKYSEWIES